MLTRPFFALPICLTNRYFSFELAASHKRKKRKKKKKEKKSKKKNDDEAKKNRGKKTLRNALYELKLSKTEAEVEWQARKEEMEMAMR